MNNMSGRIKEILSAATSPSKYLWPCLPEDMIEEFAAYLLMLGAVVQEDSSIGVSDKPGDWLLCLQDMDKYAQRGALNEYTLPPFLEAHGAGTIEIKWDSYET